MKDAFAGNFATMGQVGARVTVLRDGETLVDLWGGHTTTAREQAWSDRTLVCCMSVSKGVTAIAAHLLADRGLLDYEAPVAHYSPEFAQNGKQAITVRQAMSHQASLGIIESAQPGDIFDWDLFTTKIAAQTPNLATGYERGVSLADLRIHRRGIVRRIEVAPSTASSRKRLPRRWMPISSWAVGTTILRGSQCTSPIPTTN